MWSIFTQNESSSDLISSLKMSDSASYMLARLTFQRPRQEDVFDHIWIKDCIHEIVRILTIWRFVCAVAWKFCKAPTTLELLLGKPFYQYSNSELKTSIPKKGVQTRVQSFLTQNFRSRERERRERMSTFFIFQDH